MRCPLVESVQESGARVLAVIVLYKMLPQDSVSFQTLEAAKKHSPPGKVAIKTFFYDNTPGGQPSAQYPEESSHESSGENNGLSVAYNRALEIASEAGFDWLLTLDQDTSLPFDFLTNLSNTLAFVAPLSQVAAVVPQVSDNGRVISPAALSYNLFPKFFPAEFIGISLERTSAVNSASAVRVSALKAIGGYDPRFWLDYSDAVMYHRLHCNNFRIFIAGNIRVEHELSVLDLEQRVTLERYEDILGAESAFWDECMGRVGHLALFLRFSYRLVYKFWRTGASLPYFKISLRYFCMRLFFSRKRRTEAWERSSQRRFVSHG